MREIEARKYDARQFLDELKQMVREIVIAVLSDNTNRRVAYTAAEEEKKAERKRKQLRPDAKLELHAKKGKQSGRTCRRRGWETLSGMWKGCDYQGTYGLWLL